MNKTQKIIICGKKGSGKTTLANELEKRGFLVITSYTTRPKRHEDEKGHIFISKDDYPSLQNQAILENNLYDYRYFMTKNQIKENDVIIIDPTAIADLLALFPDICFNIIYVTADEKTRLEKLKERPDYREETIVEDNKLFDFDKGDCSDIENYVNNNYKDSYDEKILEEVNKKTGLKQDSIKIQNGVTMTFKNNYTNESIKAITDHIETIVKAGEKLYGMMQKVGIKNVYPRAIDDKYIIGYTSTELKESALINIPKLCSVLPVTNQKDIDPFGDVLKLLFIESLKL